MRVVYSRSLPETWLPVPPSLLSAITASRWNPRSTSTTVVSGLITILFSHLFILTTFSVSNVTPGHSDVHVDESKGVGVDKESFVQHFSTQGGSLTTAKLADEGLIDGKAPVTSPQDAVHGGLPPHGSTPALSRASSKEKLGKLNKEKSCLLYTSPSPRD